MATFCLLFLLLLGQGDKTPSEPTRSAKIQTVMLLQDQRLGADPRLARLLTDSDDAVRERAVLACGSIQDTLLLHALLERLRDDAPPVREAAAFSIGQIGALLSASGKSALERECLEVCASKVTTSRLLEEMGKFGSAEGLSEVLAILDSTMTIPRREALILGIARYAIRGIATDRTLHFLIRLASEPSAMTWEVAYALQRMAPKVKPEPRFALALAGHQDPLVRMNAATLLGKIGDTLNISAALVQLSSLDADWRVRANALKAIGTLGPHPAPMVINELARAFTDSNEHVALSSIGAIAEALKDRGSIPPAADSVLWRIAENSPPHVSFRRQAEAFTAVARILRSKAFHRLSRLRPPDDRVHARHLIALGMTGDSLALPMIQRGLRDDSPRVVSAALEGVQNLAVLNPGNSRIVRSATNSAIGALESGDISVLSTAASLLADSLFRTLDAVPPLLHALQQMQEPEDVEAMQQMIQTLGSLRDRRATEVLIRKLSSTDRIVAHLAAEALQEITGRSYLREIRVTERPATGATDTVSLVGDPDTVLIRMQTSAGTVVLELYPGIAPYTVASFLKLASRRFFDGITFHRVVPNFVVQGGDPRGDGWGGPGYSIRSEFSLLRYGSGMIGMASAGKDTEGSQFFITHSPQPHLDGRYTIFGKVRTGMEVVDRIQVGDTILHVEPYTQAKFPK